MKVKHTVLFIFKSNASAQDIEKVFTTIGELKQKIPGILSFEYGKNSSLEQLPSNWTGISFTHGFEMIFESEEALQSYLPHPDHQACVQFMLQYLDNVCVFDRKIE